MVPTGRNIPPERVNAMLNTFFGILASEPPAIAEAFIKDRADWVSFNRMAIKAAWQNPSLLLWIWDLAGPKDLFRWLGSYWNFSVAALISAFIRSWFPSFLQAVQPWVEPRLPSVWLWLLAQSYAYTNGAGFAQPAQRARGRTVDRRLPATSVSWKAAKDKRSERASFLPPGRHLKHP